MTSPQIKYFTFEFEDYKKEEGLKKSLAPLQVIPLFIRQTRDPGDDRQ